MSAINQLVVELRDDLDNETGKFWENVRVQRLNDVEVAIWILLRNKMDVDRSYGFLSALLHKYRIAHVKVEYIVSIYYISDNQEIMLSYLEDHELRQNILTARLHEDDGSQRNKLDQDFWNYRQEF